MANEFLIRDAATFYSMIKSNPLYKDKDDKMMRAALDDYFNGTTDINKAMGYTGRKKEEFLFFQGMLAGCLVMSKIYRHHIATEAATQNIDPKTGKSYGENKNN